MKARKRASDRCTRRKLRSPGHPPGWQRENLCRFWRSLDAVGYATLEWVDWHNNRRLLEPIGNIPPAEAEAAYFASLEETAIAT